MNTTWFPLIADIFNVRKYFPTRSKTFPFRCLKIPKNINFRDYFAYLFLCLKWMDCFNPLSNYFCWKVFYENLRVWMIKGTQMNCTPLTLTGVRFMSPTHGSFFLNHYTWGGLNGKSNSNEPHPFDSGWGGFHVSNKCSEI